MHFSGSYLPTDVELLIDVIPIEHVDNQQISDKEQLIQSGKRHYSDMLTLEKAPSQTHEQLYEQALYLGKQRMANDILRLATTLHHLFAKSVNQDNPLILISLVRAGLPIGVLLQRAFADNQSYHLPSQHFGISIIRERGIDDVALQYILENFPNSPIIFIDGWTGKGAIFGELQHSLQSFIQKFPQFYTNIFHQKSLIPPLVTLTDPAGVAWLSASSDDWLMPASLLNSTVSGLISRTLFRETEQNRHRCVFYKHFQNIDKSLSFVETIDTIRQKTNIHSLEKLILTPNYQPTFATKNVIEHLAKTWQIENMNRIKPTIAEATRAVLRRQPECVLLNDNENPQATVLLRHLCAEKNVKIINNYQEITPYTAVTLIQKRDNSE